jgi:hypothetical protein
VRSIWLRHDLASFKLRLKALEAKAEPRREGKLVAFDEASSVNTMATGISWVP